MKDLITYKSGGEVLYSSTENLPVAIDIVNLHGLKAFHGIRCVRCGHTSKGLSGWLGEVFNLKIKCLDCDLVFEAQRKVKLIHDWHIHQEQQKLEREFLHIYSIGFKKIIEVIPIVLDAEPVYKLQDKYKKAIINMTTINITNETTED